MSGKKWRVAGINFEHFHMGDNLRMVVEHPQAELVGICDEQPERMESTIAGLQIPRERVFLDVAECIEKSRPDLIVLCPAAAHHAEWTERVAPYGVPLLIEKPFAASLAEADRMIMAAELHHCVLAINWPLAWYPVHRTAKHLIDEGRIGTVLSVHYYDGNRGPLWHLADKLERTAAEVQREKPHSWFYKRRHGGGSLLDYLGYGTTLGTWFLGGRKPLEVTSTVFVPPGLEVDEQSITVARYDTGLSKFETRWGTFTDPWTHQPQPKCGFVIVGQAGTISSYDYESHVTLQTADSVAPHAVEADPLEPPLRNPVEYMLDCLQHGRPIEGPLSVEVSRTGQQIVDTAVMSAEQGGPVRLLGG